MKDHPASPSLASLEKQIEVVATTVKKGFEVVNSHIFELKDEISWMHHQLEVMAMDIREIKGCLAKVKE